MLLGLEKLYFAVRTETFSCMWCRCIRSALVLLCKRNARKTHGFLCLAQLMQRHTPRAWFKWNHWGATATATKPFHFIVCNIQKTYMTLNVCSLRMSVCLFHLSTSSSSCFSYSSAASSHFIHGKWCYVCEHNLWFHDKCVYLCLWLFSKIEYLPNIRAIYYFTFDEYYEIWIICVTVFSIAFGSNKWILYFEILVEMHFVCIYFFIRWLNGDRVHSHLLSEGPWLIYIPTSVSQSTVFCNFEKHHRFRALYNLCLCCVCVMHICVIAPYKRQRTAPFHQWLEFV